MNQRTSFLTRFLALALALVLIVSNASPAMALRVFAADSDEITITTGKLVADNYELTVAEKNLLTSGYLADSTISYTLPGDELVTVDAENAKITAENHEDWVPVSAVVKAASGETETVAFEGNTASYTKVEGAFSVEVSYTLDVEVAADVQANLLNAAADLKQGVANLAAAGEVDLMAVEAAMPTLLTLVDGIDGGLRTLKFEAEAAEAVTVLNAQMQENGKLLLTTSNNTLADAIPVQYLLENGASYKAVVAATYENLAAILGDKILESDAVDSYLEITDATKAAQWKTFKAMLGDAVANLEPVANDEWAVLSNAAVKSGVDYVALNALVAAVETTTAATVTNPLHVADATVQVNSSMYNVNVTVELMVVTDKVDSDELVKVATKTAVVTLPEGATAAEVLAAVEANGVVAAAKAEWADVCSEENFETTATEIPATLTEDVDYVVTIAPKSYNVTDWGDMTTARPYGYKMTLPKHEESAKSYDYVVNGEAVVEGTVITITGDTEITRTVGKAYTPTDLYTVIGENFGNEVAQAILESGALLGNESIAVRVPDTSDNLLTLVENLLTAVASYASDYKGLSWVPYSFGVNGTENFFDGITGNWGEPDAQVQYILRLTNIDTAKVADVLAMVNTLKTDADSQNEALERLNGYYADLSTLNKSMLGGLRGSISVTDLTPEDNNENDAKNLELRAYFTALVDSIIANNMNGNELMLTTMLDEYRDANNGGLRYYYGNAEAVIAEVASLSEALKGLSGDPEKEAALAILLEAFQYGHYVEKISRLGIAMGEIKEDLKAPNANIDLTSANLGKLISALTAEGDVETAEADTPYILSGNLFVTDVTRVMIEAKVSAAGKHESFYTSSIGRKEVVTAEMVNALQAQIDAWVAGVLKDKLAYYTVTVEGGNLADLVGEVLGENTVLTYTYAPKQYTVVIDGEADQTVTVEDLEIELPKHDEYPNYKYEYTVNGEKAQSGVYTFKQADLDTLFADGSYTITRTVINVAQEKLEQAIGNLNSNKPEGETVANDYELVLDENGNPVRFIANIAGTPDGLMNFAMDLTMNLPYTYVGLNGEMLMGLNDSNELEVSLQTLINALLNDNSFCNQTLIDLGTNGKGKVLTASMQLGDNADDLYGSDLEFVLNMKSVPAQTATAAKALKAATPYVKFQSNNGILDVKLTLPEMVYEVYLTALLATNELDKTNMNAINTQIAFEFLYDYYEIVLNSDANTTTYQNTLEMIDGLVNDYTDYDIPNYDLTQYEDYYQKVKAFLKSENVDVVIEPDDVTVTLTAKGQSIKQAVEFVGFDLSAYEVQMNLIKELKEGGTVTGTAVATLTNTFVDYEAALVDIRADGANKVLKLANKFDYTTDLVARSEQLAGAAGIVLLDDVDGDLTFNAATVLDLNGKTINGNITANGKLIIVDSTVYTANCGGVNGTVTGDAIIIAGKYSTDVSEHLMDGYVQNNGVVENVCYTIENIDGVATYVVNTSFYKDVEGYLPDVRALAVDMALDIATNCYGCASVTVEGNEIYDFGAVLGDVLGILASDSKIDDGINRVLDTINAPGITNVANMILADLCDFGAIEEALANNEPVAQYTVSIQPWTVEIEHVTDGDYMSAGIGSNDALEQTFTVAVKVEGDLTDNLERLFGELDNIADVSASVNLEQPEWAGDTNTLSVVGSGKFDADIDLSKDNRYITLITVFLANGNPEQADALVAALNADDMETLKALLDNMTIQDVIDALKELSRNDNYADVAKSLGVTVELDNDVDHIYYVALAAAGKAIERFEESRFGYLMDKVDLSRKFGMLDKDGDGVYVWTTDKWDSDGNGYITAEGDVTRRGATVYAEASLHVAVSVKLFAEDCLWGDANHDGNVDAMDATLVLQYSVDTLADGQFFCTKRTDVNGDGNIDAMDATLILQHSVGTITKFPVEG